MIQKKKYFFFIFFFYCSIFLCQEKIPLTQYLKIIENQFEIGFSYVDQDLESHYIVAKKNKTIKESLQFLENNSLFSFNELPDKSIAIKKSKEIREVCGIIFFGNTEQLLANALITTPYQKLTSDENGVFSVFLKNTATLIEVSYSGLENQIFNGEEFVATPCKRITLKEKIEVLNTITLNNYLAKGISKNEDGSLTVNYTNFDILPGLIEPDVLLTIQALPGIQSVNETISYLNIRGGTNDQNLILWDGIKMYQNSHFFGLISAFNSELIEEVDLVKNGTSASIGDGVSGVIAMKSAKEVNTTLKAGAGINLISADAFADIPLGEKASIQIAGRKSINNLFASPTFNSYAQRAFQNTEVTNMGAVVSSSNDDFSFFDTSIRGIIKPTQKDLIRFNFVYLGNQLNFLENATIENNLQSLQSDLTQDNFSGGIFYERNWNTNFTTQAQLYGSSYQLQATNFDILNAQRLIQENNILESGLKLTGNYIFSENLKGNFGYQLNETGITNFEDINNPFFERTDKQVLITNSGWAEAIYQPSRNTSIGIGLRSNHISKFNEVLFEPRLQFTQRFLKYFTFEVLGEIKSQTTSQVIDFQEDFLGVENRRWVLSKPDEIPIIKGRQISAGITVNRRGWLVSAEPYIKQVQGITARSQGFLNQFQNERAQGEFTVYGVDFLINKRFKKINTWLSYSYAENNYFFESFTPQEFPNNLDIRHTITYGIDYTFNRFNIAGGFNWHTGRPTTLLNLSEVNNNNTLNFDTPNITNIDDYMRIDLSATYRFKIGKTWDCFAGASVWNLLDRVNTVNHFFMLGADNQVQEIDEIALRFTPNFSFRVRF